MASIERDLGQGGLPSLSSSKQNIWLVEVEAFPPIYKVFTSGGRIANEVLKDLASNKAIKETFESYSSYASQLDHIPDDFFDIPVNLISICAVPTEVKATFKKRLESLLAISPNSIPDLDLRWPAIYNLARKEIRFLIGKVGIYNGSRDYFVADIDDISNTHQRNLEVLAAMNR